MKKFLKSTLSLVLCLLLVSPWALLSPVFAAETITLLPGQKLLSVADMNEGLQIAPDGFIDGDEYGAFEPQIRLTANGGFWTEDLEGNAMTENVPEYIDLYLAQKGEFLYLGLIVKEQAHTGNQYVIDTFLGFGDDTNAYTMNTGNTTSLLMEKYTRAKYLREWWDMRDTDHTAKIYAADGTVTEGTPLYSDRFEYPLVHWGDVDVQEDGSVLTTYEIELSIKDSVIGSGKEWSKVPEIGYFGFDLALYDGTERCGTLHFNTDLTGEENAPKSAPHVLDLAGNVEVDPNSRIADLASLSIERGILTPDFDANVYDYSITMAYGYGIKVNAEAKATAAGAKVEIFGAEALGKDGDGVVTVVCTAASGYQKTYKINVKRDYIQSEFAAEGTEGLNALFTQFAEMEWSAADSVVIKLSGEVTSSEALLLGQKTFFNELGTKLPITIDGAGEAVIKLDGESIASANDITFRNLKMPLEGKEFDFHAGAGKVVFENVDFGETENAKVAFFGDTDSLAPFAGWSTENLVKALDNKLLPTSITFKGTTKYVPQGETLMGAVGFDGEKFEAVEGVSISLTPAKLRASFIVDGAEISAAGARVGIAPVAEASVEMKAGKAASLGGDALTTFSETAESYKGKTFVTVSGGTVESVSGISAATHRGNVTVSISEADAVTSPTTVGEVKFNRAGEIIGNAYLDVSGGVITGDVIGGGANLTTYNTVTGGTFKGGFYGVGEQSAKKIVNNISGGSFESTVYGGSYGISYVRGIENNISGGAFADAFFGGSRSGSVDGNIVNNVSGGSFTHTNTIKSSGENPDMILLPCFAGGNDGGVVNGSITNNVTGGTFSRSFSGAGNGDVNGNITNNLTGKVAVNDAFFGGTSHSGMISTITGKIVNNVKAAKDGSFPSFKIAFTTGQGFAFVGGSSRAVVVGSVENNVEAGSFNNRFVGGCAAGDFCKMIPGKDGISVRNNISGGTFGDYFYGATFWSDLEGDVVTDISGGIFKEEFTGGGRTGEFQSDITLTIRGGEFKNNVFGASWGINAAQQASPVNRVDMTVSGGTFYGTVYAGGRGAAPLVNGASLTITGGAFNGNIVAGSATASTASTNVVDLTIEAKDGDLSIAGSLVSRSENETILLKGAKNAILLGANASLAFTEYDGAAQTVTLTEAAVADHTYLSVPADKAGSITFQGEVPVTDGVWKTPAA